LNRIFRASVGASPGATIERIRLLRAERLLARSDMTVAAMAAATGFADQYHLSRRFHRCFGVAPAKYRRLAATQDLPLPPEIVAILPLVDRLAAMI
jgi:AraC family transcriptional regulator